MNPPFDDEMNPEVETIPHVPVLLDEVVRSISPLQGKIIVDGTFGAGGYSQRFLNEGAKRVIGIDRDPNAIIHAQPLLEKHPNLDLCEGQFAHVATHLRGLGIDQIDCFVLDLGVSSMQLDQAERGFSFQKDGPLDMRMSQSGQSAADIVNTADEHHIARILWLLGDEKKSRSIARMIVERRSAQKFETTLDLAKVIASVVKKSPKEKKHPATRSFQALRLAVNSELEEVAAALTAAETILKPGGILAVVTFHSLEDRIVKRFLQSRAATHAGGSRHLPNQHVPPPSFTLEKNWSIDPSLEEVARNPRARSARLRYAVRTENPASTHDTKKLSGLPNWQGQPAHQQRKKN